MTADQKTYAMEDLLRFYTEAGLDIAMSEIPVDQFALSEQSELSRTKQNIRTTNAPSFSANTKTPVSTAQKNNARPPNTPAKPVNNQAVPDAQQINLARNIARQSATLQDLNNAIASFDGCGLRLTAKNLCFEDGNSQADIMLIGDVPGRDEDMEGLPFAGRTGELLDNMLRSINLKREQTYLANMIYWRPPGNRTPTPLEIELCQPFIERQIELANPKLIVSFGGPVTKLLTGTAETILRIRGSWLSHKTASGQQIPVMPTLHPAYLLRSPAQKKFAWQDLQSIMAKHKALQQP